VPRGTATAIAQISGDAQAGPGFADPDYDLSVDWLAARERFWPRNPVTMTLRDPAHSSDHGSSRNDQTCPGEMSKSCG